MTFSAFWTGVCVSAECFFLAHNSISGGMKFYTMEHLVDPSVPAKLLRPQGLVLCSGAEAAPRRDSSCRLKTSLLWQVQRLALGSISIFCASRLAINKSLESLE